MCKMAGCSVAAYDPWRITVNVRQLGRTGFAAETELQDQHSVYAEMATHKVSDKPLITDHFVVLPQDSSMMSLSQFPLAILLYAIAFLRGRGGGGGGGW